MPRRHRPPLTQRLVDRALGVSRRRRKVAVVAIGAGLALLRPALRRAAYTTTVLVGLVVIRVVAG